MTSRFSPLLLALPAVVLLGCGGPKSYHVAGKVTHKGAPVAVGHVTFDPDPAKNPSGIGGNAPLRDGTYDTRNGTATGGGAFIVKIDGFDGKSNPDQPNGNVLFSWTGNVDLPTQDTTKDFDVPAGGTKKAPAPRKEIVP